MAFEVERELETAIATIGGQHVAKLVGRAPGHENADFIFTNASVVVELKCLNEDKLVDERIIQKASQIYAEELRLGRAPVILFGTRRMTTEGFSEEYTRKIMSLYRVPIERQVRKADSQIATTNEKLDLRNYKGLLIVANNNHSALDPWHGWFIMNEILRQPLYDNINGAIYFSGKLAAAMPGKPERLDYWLEFTRPHLPQLDGAFLSDLKNAWHRHLSCLLFGESTFKQVPIDFSELVPLESKRET